MLKLLHEGERGKSESQPKSKRQDVGWNRGGGSDFCECKRRFSFCAGKQRRQDRGTGCRRRGHYCFPAAAEKRYLCGRKDGAEIDRRIFRRHDFCDSEGDGSEESGIRSRRDKRFTRDRIRSRQDKHFTRDRIRSRQDKYFTRDRIRSRQDKHFTRNGSCRESDECRSGNQAGRAGDRPGRGAWRRFRSGAFRGWEQRQTDDGDETGEDHLGAGGRFLDLPVGNARYLSLQRNDRGKLQVAGGIGCS